MKYLSFLLLFVLISCSKDAISPATNVDNTIVPFKAGNYWIYQEVFYNTDGGIISKKFDTITVLKTYKKPSTGTTLFQTHISNETELGVFNDEYGLWKYTKSPNKETFDGTSYIIKYNAKKLDTFNTFILTTLRDTKPVKVIESKFWMKVVSLDEMVNINNKQYSCIKSIRESDNKINSKFKLYQFCQKGIGLVKSISYYKSNNKPQNIRELVSYKLN